MRFPLQFPKLPLRMARPGEGDKSAFFARGPAGGPRGQGKRAALCLHGFTGTPFEVRPIAETLAAQGYTVLAPVLAGHGGTVRQLASTRFDDWLASAEQALQLLRNEVDGAPVAIAGFSLGGLLALRLTHQHPDWIAALAVLSVPLRLRPLEVAAVRVVMRLPALLRVGPLASLPKARGFDTRDPDMARLNPGLSAMPLAGVHSLIQLAALVRADLPGIRAPTLVMHGAHDRTVPLEDSLELAGTIGSTELERLWLAKSGHLLAIDVERRAVVDAIGRFFARHLLPPNAEVA